MFRVVATPLFLYPYLAAMAENKKSFLLYTDIINTVSKLPDELSGKLFKMILDYVNDKNPTTDDLLLEIAFEPIKQSLKRDLRKYEDIREKRREAGLASAEKRKQNEQVSTSVESVEQTPTNSTVSVSDSVNVSKDIYIYNKFYDEQISKTSNKEYHRFVKYLFGDNMYNQKLSGVLSIKNQLTEPDFVKVMEKYRINKKKIGDTLTKIENDKKYYKGKTNLYRTLLNWSEDRFIK